MYKDNLSGHMDFQNKDGNSYASKMPAFFNSLRPSDAYMRL